ncbi:MAG: hypothetical protein M1433_02275 [Candidatus Parvarchaeota archaeon]|nr:hypothetical protein [Candidatus Parvarchaeota archaeon]
MALMEVMSFVNAGILMISFALLLVVLSFNVSNINSVAVFANAKSVASAIGTRFITSPNCFAYKLDMNYYSNSPALQGGPVYSVSDTEPGVIDVNKFITNRFLSCIQYVYFSGATQIPVLTSRLAAFTGVSAQLIDTQDPSNLGSYGSVTMSNFPQLNYGANFGMFENTMNQVAQYGEYVALGLSIGTSVALGIASAGTLGVNVIVALNSNSHNSIVPQYAALSTLFSEDTYTESFPVTIQFTNGQGQPLFQNSGILNVEIYYGLSPYSP